MGDRRKDNVVRGRFRRGTVSAGSYGRRRPVYDRTDWLYPAAYNALSREEKVALAARRRQKARPFPPKRRRRSRVGGYLRYQAKVGLFAVVAIVTIGWAGESGLSLTNLRAKSAPMAASFGYCHVVGGTNCVVDGDTFWLQGRKIRIADIDAPETHEPRCASEKALGDRATLRLQQLLNGGTITLRPADRVLVDGRSVGDVLVSEGLARWYAGYRRPWC